MWWWVPVHQEARYAECAQGLLANDVVGRDETIDLGHLAQIAPAELLGAGLWQLFKGIESPYKSVLKLLLVEVYASEHPHVECLSLRFKQAVFANRLDLDELDPYMVVYRRIEEYLTARNEPERLELVRRALYLKVNRKLTGNTRTQSWQRSLLERLASEWHWDQRQLALLDSRSQWKVRQVSAERRALVNELNYSYRFLTQFARTEQTVSLINKRDLNVLGRRLYAAFERKADKVEFINPGIAPDLAEDTLTLVQSPNKKEPGQTQWGLYNGSLTALEWEHFAPIKRSRELLELLTWCHRNGVIDSSTRLALHPGTSDMSEFELFNLLGSLQQSIALPLSTVAEEPLLRAAIADHLMSDATCTFTILSGSVTAPPGEPADAFFSLSTTSMPDTTSPTTVYCPFRLEPSANMMKNCELALSTLSPRRAMPTTPRLNGTCENSCFRFGYFEPPVPLKFWPSPVCAMKPSITRWNGTLL